MSQVGPIRKFWRRYHLTKIVIILGLGEGLLVGTYLFAIAKSTNGVNDLQIPWKRELWFLIAEEKRGRGPVGSKGNLWSRRQISSKDLQNAVVATGSVPSIKMMGGNYGRFFLAILTAERSGGSPSLSSWQKNTYLSRDQTVWTEGQSFPCHGVWQRNTARNKSLTCTSITPLWEWGIGCWRCK